VRSPDYILLAHIALSSCNWQMQPWSVSQFGKHPRGVPVLAMAVFLSVIGIDFVGSRHLVFN
jgi:hypothetical protein